MRSAVAVVLLLAGCATRAPVEFLRRLPPDTAQECAEVCQSIGLQLSAVVVVASAAGCVCEAKPSARSALPGGATAASAGAVIVTVQQQQQQQSTAGK
jgi:outer membrane murein-binding lipoprotein Lpp